MNKDKISKLGYKKNSPYKNRESLTIGSNFITTEDMAFPILAMGDGGESQVLYPNTGSYLFPNSSTVQEYKLDFNKNTNTGMKNMMANGGMMNEYDILSSYLPTLSPEDQDTFIDSYQRSNPRQKQEILMKCGGMMKYQQGGYIPSNQPMPKGMQVPREMANAEVEGGETALTPDGMLMKFNGPSHAQGGINTNLEEGTKIFSEHLKVPEEVQRGLGLKKVNKKLSYAKLSEKLKTKPFIEMMNETDDPYKLNAAKVQLEKNMAMLESLFFAQEKDKEMKGMSAPQYTNGERVFAQTGDEVGKDLSYISNRFLSRPDGTVLDPVTNKYYERQEDGTYLPYRKRMNIASLVDPISQNPNVIGSFNDMEKLNSKKSTPFLVGQGSLKSTLDNKDIYYTRRNSGVYPTPAELTIERNKELLERIKNDPSLREELQQAQKTQQTQQPVSTSTPGSLNRTFNASDNVLMGYPDPFDPIGAALLTGAVGLGAGPATLATGIPAVGELAALTANTAFMGTLGSASLRDYGIPGDTFRDDYSENYMKALRKQLDPFDEDNIIEYKPKPKIQPKPQPAPTVTPVPTVTPKPTLKRPSQPKFDDGSPEDAITAGEAELGPVTPFVEKSYIPPAYRAEEDYGTVDMDTYRPEPPKQKEPFGINQKLLGTLADIGLVMSDRLNIDNPTIYNRQKNPMFNRFYEFDNLETQRLANQQIQSIMNSNMPEQVKQAQIAQITAQSQDQQARVDFANAQRYEQKREADLAKLQSYTDANIDTRIADYDNWRQRMARVKDMQNQFKSWRKQQLVGTLKDQLGYMEKLKSINELNPYFERSWLTGTDRYKPQGPNVLNTDPTQGYDKTSSRQTTLPGGATVTDMGDFYVIMGADGVPKIQEKKSQKSSKMTLEQAASMYKFGGYKY